ncbi:MAG: AmmeMemoRadiSam system protein A [Ignavibacteria bacterium]|nr:AmmeMemoRadiSam system protein A [Ignavibacteria bacterium]
MYFTKEEQQLMKSIARNAVEQFVLTGRASDGEYNLGSDDFIMQEYNISEIPEKLKQWHACFVTIRKNGELRGCIGTIIPHNPLYKSIIENAVGAAVRDPRFYPVTKDELKNLTYEVTVLSEPKEIKYKSSKDLLSQIKGKGVIIKKSFFTAVYLPQVWEHFTSPEEFISSLCRKAGLPSDEWKNLTLQVQVFEALK